MSCIIERGVEVSYVYNALDKYIMNDDYWFFMELNKILVWPLVSNPFEKDGDGDGILDIDEVRPVTTYRCEDHPFGQDHTDNGFEECTVCKKGIFDRYKYEMYSKDNPYYEYHVSRDDYKLDSRYYDYEKNESKLNPLKEDTVESLFPELAEGHEKNFYNNLDGKMHYLDVKGNDVAMVANVKFSGDYELDARETCSPNDTNKALETPEDLRNQTQKETINILNRLDEGFSIKDLCIDGIIQRWSGEYLGNIYDFFPGMKVNVGVKLNVLDSEDPSTDDIPAVKINVIKSSGRSNAGYNIINLYAVGSLVNVESTTAHEFGHAPLRLGDAYGDLTYSRVNNGYRILPQNEYFINPKIDMKLPGYGALMSYNGNAVTNDIEMVMAAIMSNHSRQSFVHSPDTKISDAIKERPLYTFAGSDTPLIWWDEHTFIPLDAMVVSEKNIYYSIYNGQASVLGFVNIPKFNFNITIPPTVLGYPVTKINDWAFFCVYDYDIFKYIGNVIISIDIPDSVVDIGSYAFTDCNKLEKVTGGVKVEKVGYKAFESCAGLTNISFTSLVSIEDYGFWGCTKLIQIPDSVKTIGRYAFASCDSLEEISIPNGVTYISECAFVSCKKLRKVIIPDNVRTIGVSAFRGCINLEEIIISDKVTTIGDIAFSGCSSLAEIVIPANITKIGSEAFRDCTNLQSINFARDTVVKGNLHITSYSKDMFDGCDVSKLVIYAPDDFVAAYSNWFDSKFTVLNVDQFPIAA
jgi:hypothetical protein